MLIYIDEGLPGHYRATLFHFWHRKFRDADKILVHVAHPVLKINEAAVAQLVEHVIRNDGVVGSNPISGTMP